MSCSLSQIEKICRSFGGVNLIQIILPEGLITPIDSGCTLVQSENLEFLGAELEPFSIAFARNSAQFSERHVSSNRAGDYFEQSLSFEVPKSRLVVSRNIQFLKNRRVHILFRDRNGQVRIILFAHVTADTSTRQKRAERNGYVFKASAQSRIPALFYTGEIINLPQSSNYVMGDPDTNQVWGDPDSGEVWKF